MPESVALRRCSSGRRRAFVSARISTRRSAGSAARRSLGRPCCRSGQWNASPRQRCSQGKWARHGGRARMEMGRYRTATLAEARVRRLWRRKSATSIGRAAFPCNRLRFVTMRTGRQFRRLGLASDGAAEWAGAIETGQPLCPPLEPAPLDEMLETHPITKEQRGGSHLSHPERFPGHP